MKKLIRFCLSAGVVFALFACQAEEERNTVPLPDPWLKARTPASLRVQTQIGPATIVDNWRDDELGTITVTIISPMVNLAAVEIIQLLLPEGATADISEGGTLDFSTGYAQFTVTSENGFIRTYTVRFVDFQDEIAGVYTAERLPGIVSTSGGGQDFRAVYGGTGGNEIQSTLADKDWQWNLLDGTSGEDNLEREYDNILSFKLEFLDTETGVSAGTVVHHPGADGFYTEYWWSGAMNPASTAADNPVRNLNNFFRLIPRGTSWWEKRPEKLGDDDILRLYLFDYTTRAPLQVTKPTQSTNTSPQVLDVLPPGLVRGRLTVPDMATGLRRNWPGPYTQTVTSTEDHRWMVYNVRETFMVLRKTSTEPHPDHASWVGVNF